MPSSKAPFPNQRKTNPLIWLLAILCTIVSIAVIITGVVMFVGYMVIHPRVPFISVASASLDTLRYDQAGVLEIQMAIVIRAENDNARAHASFSHTSFILSFQELVLAKLVADPFDVSKHNYTDFNYVLPSSQVPLDPLQMEEVDTSLKKNQISFDLRGSSRAMWRVGPFRSVKFWCHLECQLRFLTSNRTYINSHCSTKSK